MCLSATHTAFCAALRREASELGGNKDGPDIHISYLKNRDAQSMHFDWAFPFGSAGGFAQHTGDFIEEGIDRKVLGKTSDPPYDEVGP